MAIPKARADNKTAFAFLHTFLIKPAIVPLEALRIHYQASQKSTYKNHPNIVIIKSN